MKNLTLLIIFIGLLSCNDDESKNPILEPQLSYSLDNGENFSTDEPTMSYDANQQVTFIKYTESSLKIRVNFKGKTSGVYSNENGIFYKTRYNSDGSVLSFDMICDTFTGIEITVDEYGEIGEMIVGSFKADNCDGESSASTVTGSFRVVRTE